MTTQFKVSGMQCEACVSHVKKALEAVPGVLSAQVNLDDTNAVVQHDNADKEAMQKAVAEEGYELHASE